MVSPRGSLIDPSHPSSPEAFNSSFPMPSWPRNAGCDETLIPDLDFRFTSLLLGSSNSGGDDGGGGGGGSTFHDACDDFPFYDRPTSDYSAVPLDESEPKRPSSPEIPPGLRRRHSGRVPAGVAAGVESGFAARSRENRFRLYRDLTEGEGPIERARSDVEESGSISVPDIARRDESEDSATTTSNDAGVGDMAAESIVTPSEVCEGVGERKDGASIVTTVDDERIGDSVDSADSADSAVPLGGTTSSSLLISIAGILIKAIGFQINLLVSFLTFPFWCFRTFYAFVFDPYATMRCGVKCLTGKISSVCNSVCDKMSPFVREWFEDNKSIWKLVLRCGWGLVWSMYVCFVLVGLLVTAALISGLIMRFLVADPIRIEDKLNFDYTKHGPAAYLPVSSCAGADCGMKCGGMVVDCGETNRGSDAVSSSFGTETTKVKILQLSWQDACTSGLRKVQQDPALNVG